MRLVKLGDAVLPSGVGLTLAHVAILRGGMSRKSLRRSWINDPEGTIL